MKVQNYNKEKYTMLFLTFNSQNYICQLIESFYEALHTTVKGLSAMADATHLKRGVTRIRMWKKKSVYVRGCG